ncbi:vegetative cell wall protein gp1-like [Lucilia sericata]|uniref:vegetative cell wall protein gp1-like n=1 Tax=Lucilia sericata TaxID=13632 RepID=UPI0018A80C13|nr:vegetative cell wall protein gp1-like [Lucilia sericata]
MKFIVVALALVACVVADVSELGYDYHAPAPVEHHQHHHEHHEHVMSFVPEVPHNTYIPPAAHAPAPAPEYHPAPAPAPVPEYHPAPAPQNTYIPPAAPAPVPEYHPAPAPAPVPEYHPAPVAPHNDYLPPSGPVESSADFGNDGYRYKSVRRVVYRRRF